MNNVVDDDDDDDADDDPTHRSTPLATSTLTITPTRWLITSGRKTKLTLNVKQ